MAIIIIGAIFIFFCLLMLLRGEIVFRARIRAIDYAFANHMTEYFRNWQSQNAQVMDFRKWTFKQFYPNFQ